jgi:hypothetical protein
MFLHCVALNRAEIRIPWHQWASQANSLFWFRLATAGVLLIPTLPVIGFMVLVIFRMTEHGFGVGKLVVLIALSFLLILLSIVFLVLARLTIDFVVPIQYLRRSSCLNAWREFLPILQANVGSFLLYLLFRLLLAIAIGAVVLIVILATCCVAGCLFAIPYLGTVLMLPIHVFERSYSAAFLAQLGSEYNVFADPL